MAKPTTASRRRTGKEDSETRSQLVTVTERLMVREGYAAVTSRRVAIEAGVTAPLVHYYFPSLDDLFVAVLRRRAEQQLERQARILAGDDPLRALWRFHRDPKAARALTELMALANHRKSIRGELAAHAERFRQAEIAAIEAAVADGRLDLGGASPAAVQVLLATSARGLVNEEAIGMAAGHDEAAALLEQLIARAAQGWRS